MDEWANTLTMMLASAAVGVGISVAIGPSQAWLILGVALLIVIGYDVLS